MLGTKLVSHKCQVIIFFFFPRGTVSSIILLYYRHNFIKNALYSAVDSEFPEKALSLPFKYQISLRGAFEGHFNYKKHMQDDTKEH